MQLVKGLVALYSILRNFLIVFAACKQLSCFSGNCVSPPPLSSPGCHLRCAEGKRKNTGLPHVEAGGIGSGDFSQFGLSQIWLPGEREEGLLRGLAGLGLLSNQYALAATHSRVLPF